MSRAIDHSSFPITPDLDGDDAEETERLRVLAAEAGRYITSFHWCPPLDRLLLAFGVGGLLGLFLARFERPVEGFEDQELWLVVGDLPPAYFVTEDSETPAEALETYCKLMEEWADQVLSGGDTSECFPIAAEPTVEHAQMLKSRLEFIRDQLIPDA
jgi:hypothetical protein